MKSCLEKVDFIQYELDFVTGDLSEAVCKSQVANQQYKRVVLQQIFLIQLSCTPYWAYKNMINEGKTNVT